ncbi:hypothetical protein [Fusibacter sp. JL216-2]|uniref:hypothetical protein n=1 Tax=Fusibacter sp. JL216-2 TaxID=3071453 RepID=UPI003D33E3E3
MDYLETTVIIAVSLFVMVVMGFVLFDVGKDVVKAARKEQEFKRARKKAPDNVVKFSRENRRKTRAIK